MNVKAISPSLEWEGNQSLHVLFSSPMIVVQTGVSSVAAQIEHNRSSEVQDRLPSLAENRLSVLNFSPGHFWAQD